MKNPSMKHFSLQEIYNNNKTKVKILWLNCTRKLNYLWVCVQSHASQGTVWRMVKYIQASPCKMHKLICLFLTTTQDRIGCYCAVS